jgi:5-methylcytosine-specific restriction endonuclease McrA
MTKVCIDCRQVKDIILFWRNKKSPDGRLNSCRSCRLEYQRSRKEINNERARLYRKTHPDARSISAMHKKRFGGLRDNVLARDNYSCKRCGMTDKEHMAKWNRHITVDHIDGLGRNVQDPNNNIDNLQTLCLSCHGRKDKLRGLYGI